MGDVSIVGMACLFPGAPDLSAYWQNILTKTDSIGEPPSDWTGDFAYDPDSDECDRIYTRRGGYVGDLARFDAVRFGIAPNTVDGSEPEHFLSLQVAQQALEDGGYPELPLPRERTAVIVGRGTYANRALASLNQHAHVIEQTLAVVRSLWPEMPADAVAALKAGFRGQLPPLDAMTAAGAVSSITSGRIANRLDLNGESYCLDAACASSLIAVDHAVRDLRLGRCDAALVGGVQLAANHIVMLLFSRLGALSRRGNVRPFDALSDGTLLGEGVGMMFLKRRADAERDGHRIYANIKGVGSASDGRAKSIVAPSVRGEALALRRAYEDAHVEPRSVELIEAHGTGMPVGDQTELEALREVFGTRLGDERTIALGSVKSMIGHLIPGSGVASLIKTALALYHKVLPPTLPGERIHPELLEARSLFHLNTETRPWVHASDPARPRRAGVSAFGFGGINAHVVLEEAPEDPSGAFTSPLLRWDNELVVVAAGSRGELVDRVARLTDRLGDPDAAEAELRDVAAAVNVDATSGPSRLAVVAASVAELRRKLGHALERLRDPARTRIRDRMGMYFFEERLSGPGRLAVLFPGEGSQYVNMLADLAIEFPEVRRCFDLADRAYADAGPPLSSVLFPPPGPAGAPEDDERLWTMETAVRAVTVANRALHTLTERLGLKPDAMAGHSSGEFAALEASGALGLAGDADVLRYLEAGSRAIRSVAELQTNLQEVVLIAAAAEQSSKIEQVIAELEGELTVAMDNCPLQVVLCAKAESAERAITRLKERGIVCNRLPFLRPYHTPDFGPAVAPLVELFRSLPMHAPTIPIYSCATAAPFPSDPAEMQALAAAQWTRSVRFRETVERMYADGIRIFVEVGPRGNLSAFVNDILGDRPALTVPLNTPSRSGISQLLHAVGLLSAHGVDLALGELTAHRAPRPFAVERASDAHPKPAPRRRTDAKLPLQLPFLSVDPGVAAGIQARMKPPAPAAPPVAAAPRRVASPAPLGSLHTPAATHPAVSPAQRRNEARVQVMERHLETMDQVLRSQTEVVSAYLGRRSRTPERPSSAPPAASDVRALLPFAGTTVREVPGQEIVVSRVLDLDEDVFLHHHVFGKKVSRLDPALEPLPIMPLTMSMEMLAEVAALLCPGRVVVGMRDIHALRWVVVEDRLPVELTARRIGDDAIEATLRPPMVDREPAPYVTGTVVFADRYPEPPLAGPLEASTVRGSRYTHGNLYKLGMFHGPSFQGIESVETWAPEGGSATLQALPTAGLFRSWPTPLFLVDPVLLDAAGQVPGHWNAEDDIQGFSMFPYHFEELRIFAPMAAAPTRLTCNLRIWSFGERQIRSNIDVVAADGRLHLQMLGWKDRGFVLPHAFFGMVYDRDDTRIGSAWDLPLAELAADEGLRPHDLASVEVTEFPRTLMLGHGKIWFKALARQMLSADERRAFHDLSFPEPRRLQWLLGRAAAKEAVRRLVASSGGDAPLHADVKVESDASGRPVVAAATVLPAPAPRISIAHVDDRAYAVAVSGTAGVDVGVDVEPLRDLGADWEAEAFADDERSRIAAAGQRTPGPWALRAWCAKEAVAKALGTGLKGHPRSLRITEIGANGRIRVTRNDKGTTHTAQTFNHDGLVAAIAFHRPLATNPSEERTSP